MRLVWMDGLRHPQAVEVYNPLLAALLDCICSYHLAVGRMRMPGRLARWATLSDRVTVRMAWESLARRRAT